jgi:transposase-like protein
MLDRYELEEHKKDIVRKVVYEGHSLRRIREEYNCSLGVLSKYLIHWQVALPRGRYAFEMRQALFVPERLRRINRSVLLNMYKDSSMAILAKELGYSRHTIRKMLEYHCIPLRDRSQIYRVRVRRHGLPREQRTQS